MADVIGTGPYKLESWSDEAVVMVRNDKYTIVDNGVTEGPAAPKKAYADKITISINKDEGSRTAAMLAGEYDLGNQALAKEYLAKSSYNGEPIKWLCTANSNFYKAAIAASGQLEAVGIKIELMVVDAGSHSSLRSDPKTGHDIGAWTVQKVDDNPVLHSTFVTGTQGWWSSDARTAAIDKMKTNPTGSAASVEGYEEWCQAVVDECPFILFGHLINYNFLKPDLVWNVQGSREYYWNMYRQ